MLQFASYGIVIHCGAPSFMSCEEYIPFIVIGTINKKELAQELVDDYNNRWLPLAVKIKDDIFGGHSWKTFNEMFDIQRKALYETTPPFPMDYIISCSHAGSYASIQLVPELYPLGTTYTP